MNGGGYHTGHANGEPVVQNVRHLASLGCWAVSADYRRGFAAGGGGNVSPADLTDADKAHILETVDMARQDVIDARDNADRVARKELGFPSKYVVGGTSAGGSLASRVTIATPGLNNKVAGVIARFGTHQSSEEALPSEGPHGFPVVIQGGMFGVISPFFNNHPWFSKATLMAKGLANLYDGLDETGYNVRLLISAQAGHGYSAYNNPDGAVQ